MLNINADRLWRSLMDLAQIGATEKGGVRRLTLTDADREELLLPCGRCRQVLYEFGGRDLLIATPDGPLSLGELLPHAFGPGDL